MAARTGKNAAKVVMAGILLAISLASPGIRHYHPLTGGEAAHHRHGAECSASEPCDHHGGICLRHLADRDPRLAEMANGDSWHLHFQLLGIECTLPQPASNQSDGKSERTAEVLALAPGQEMVPFPLTRTATQQASIAGSTPLMVVDAASMQAVVSAPPPVSFTPLCDIARQERSGVLLA